MLGGGLARVRQRRGAKPSAHLHTSPWVFALWWFGLLVFHAANLAYYVGVAVLYTSFNKTFLEFQLMLLSIGIPKAQYRKISKIHACIAAIHAFFIVLMIGSSIHARKLVFQPDMRQLYRALARSPYVGGALARIASTFPRYSSSRRAADNGRNSSASISRRVSESFGRAGSSVFARDGILGVDSVYFDHILLVRELVETGLQSYQVYRMTLVLPRMWLIRFYVVLLVLNCWAVPFLHRMYRDRETARRMICLLCDAILDMVSSIGISVVIFATYAPQYNDPNGFGFPFILWFDDEWVSNMQQEFEMMLISSWGDMASRMVFALGLLQCMDAIKEMLTPVASLEAKKPNPQDGIPVAPLPIEPVLAPPIALITQTDDVKPSENAEEKRATESAPTLASIAPAKRLHSRSHSHDGVLQRLISFVVHVVGPGLFVVWGCGILVVQLIAESKHSDNDCSLRLKPWFSSKPGCSLVEINCASIHSNGHDTAIDMAWKSFDPVRAARVVIRHCSELEVSPMLEKYHHIAGVKIYNSTVKSWASDAAVTQSAHSGLRTLALIRTDMANGELPPGLLSNDFPRQMANFYSSVTNLGTLPADLDSKWPPSMQLIFENSHFTSIPDVVVRLQPNMVSMAGSPITAVQPELIESPRLTVLQISLTRIQELPRNVKRINPQFTALFIQFTNVSTLWSYLDGFAFFTVHFPVRLYNAYGTPYCRERNEIAAGNRTSFSVPASADLGIVMDVSTKEKLAFAERALDCSEPGTQFYFPLPVEDAKHALRG